MDIDLLIDTMIAKMREEIKTVTELRLYLRGILEEVHRLAGLARAVEAYMGDAQGSYHVDWGQCSVTGISFQTESVPMHPARRMPLVPPRVTFDIQVLIGGAITHVLPEDPEPKGPPT